MNDTERLDKLERLVLNGDVSLYIGDRSFSIRYRDDGTHRCEVEGGNLREALDDIK